MVNLPERARNFALDAYGSEKDLEHPLEVRELVAGAGGDDELQAAAVLHDLVEDTDVDVATIEAEFGPRVGAVVAALTEDESLDEYVERKQEHRLRARDAGRDVALVFVADKLSNARRMRRAAKPADSLKLGHYGATVTTMAAAYPDLPLLSELRSELDAIHAELGRSTPA